MRYIKTFNEARIPDIVYHGSPDARWVKDVGKFQTSREVYKGDDDERSYFFTDSIKQASSYAKAERAFDYQNAEPSIIRAKIKMDNPFEVNAGGAIWRKFKMEIDGQELYGTRNIVKWARENGYDGIIIRNVKDDYNNTERTKSGNNYVVFSPEQIEILSHR